MVGTMGVIARTCKVLASILNFILCTAMVVFLSAGFSHAEEALNVEEPPHGPIELMSLEDLIYVEVTSVSKKAEKANEAPAAIYVITHDDIRRSGAKSIPEALRMAPGLAANQIDTNAWAISSRGFNGQYADKLLVMIDGRSVYTPLFAGTYWDSQDYVIEDIDRIEVIRGPGATLWGANAVLGVINIITKHAVDTQGGQSVTLLGTDRIGQSLRYGGEAGANGHYRVYAKGFQDDGIDRVEGSGDKGDQWQGQIGFRMDFAPNERDTFMLSADGSHSRTESMGDQIVAVFPFVNVAFENHADAKGGNIAGRWDRTLDDRSSLSLQGYLEGEQRDTAVVDTEQITFDIEFQHRISLIESNELTWGLGFRTYNDKIDNTFQFGFYPDNETLNTYSGFVQDEHRFLDDALRVTVGTKLEHNDLTGWEVQPSARFIYLLHENHTVWGAVSRAVQTRSRVDDVRMLFDIPGAGGVPVVYQADPSSDAERVYAFELGYRSNWLDKGSIDLATFYNNFHHQRDFIVKPPVFNAFPGIPVEIPYVGGDAGDAKTWGAELVFNWAATEHWILGASYTYLKIDKTEPATSSTSTVPSVEDKNPNHQFNVNSKLNLFHDLQFDTYLYYMDRLPGPDVDSHYRLDVRLGWTPTENLDLSLVGQNLLTDGHKEWNHELGGVDVEPGRSAYLKLTWNF